MDNLTIAVIAIAVAQALTILLSIGREREIKKLRELVDEQRLHIVKLSAWLAGRNAQPPQREPIREPIANNMKAPEPAIPPKDLPDTFKWFKEDADEPREIVEAREIVTGLRGRVPPEPAITPQRPSTTEDEPKRATKAMDWSREIVAGLQAGLQGRALPEPAITPQRPSTTEDEEAKRMNKAINSLREDADKARAIDLFGPASHTTTEEDRINKPDDRSIDPDA
jgi:hypothetical protein